MAYTENITEFISTIKELGYNFSSLSEEALSSAPAALTKETGVAYPGALADHAVLTYNIAKRIAGLFAKTFPVNLDSLKKVIFLQGISKAEMFIPNTNDWEINKRGMVYTFAENRGVLKAGVRSALHAMNSGIQFTPEEFEAIQIVDKTGDEYEAAKYKISKLSVIVREANEWAYYIEQNNVASSI